MKKDNPKRVTLKKKLMLSKGHTDVITSLICLPKLQFTASASLDGKIILWDKIENKLKVTYKGHTRGITSLAYDPSTILLFSAGFDHWVRILFIFIFYEFVYRLVSGILTMIIWSTK